MGEDVRCMNMIIMTSFLDREMRRTRPCTGGVIACIIIDEFGIENVYNLPYFSRTLSTENEMNSAVASQGHLVANTVHGNCMHGYRHIMHHVSFGAKKV